LARKSWSERHHRGTNNASSRTEPKSKWETPPNVVKNGRYKILWDFHIQTNKHVITNQLDILMGNKLQRRAVVMNVAIPSDSNIQKKEHKKL